MIDVVTASRTRNSRPSFDIKIDIDNLKISIEDVCSQMSNNTHSLDGHFHKIMNDIFSHLSEKCSIRAGYVLYPANFDRAGIKKFKTGDIYFNMGKIVVSQLRKSEQMAVFACTIGPDMENWARKLMKEGNPAESYLIDMTASYLTEKAMDFLHDYIGNKMAKKNLKITNRYSPGYCDWPVSDQPLLFSLLPENFCEIRLSASALMHPIKSVSGVIGIGPDVKYNEYRCDQCNMKDCTYRFNHIKDTNSIN